jgi:hypothetical protein
VLHIGGSLANRMKNLKVSPEGEGFRPIATTINSALSRSV